RNFPHVPDGSDKPLAIVEDVAFDETQRSTGMNHSLLRTKLRLPDRLLEIDFQFDSGECLARGEGTAICRSHSSVCDIAKNSAVKRTHGISLAIVGLELDRSPPPPFSYERQTQKAPIGAANGSRTGAVQRLFTSAVSFIYFVLLGLLSPVRCSIWEACVTTGCTRSASFTSSPPPLTQSERP